MTSPIKNVLALYRIANLPHRQTLLGAFLASTFLLALLELVGLASIGALLVQLFDNRETVDLYIVAFQSKTSASLFILAIWTVRAILVVLLNRFNHAFIQRIKSAIQIRQCDIAFASKSRSDQIETGRLFTALTNEVQMVTGQVFIPLSMALAEAMLVVLFTSVALFIMPLGVLVAGGIVVGGYLLTQTLISPIAKRLGEKRLDAEKDWSEKVVNMFSLRREAEVYGVVGTIKENLVRQISASNTVSGKFYSIAPLNRATLETVGVIAILGLLLFAYHTQAAEAHVMFTILGLVRMLPSATRIMAAVQSYRFASPVVEKQLDYLQQNPLKQVFESENHIQEADNQVTYKFCHGVLPRSIDLSLTAKGLVVITGESGLGKTTMLDQLADFLVAKRSSAVNFASEICYASQNSLVIEKSIHQNLAFFRDLSDEKLSSGINLLQDWGISADHFDIERRVTDFSGGEKKRVAVARALNCDDALIILDEPTAGLDKTVAQSVITSIRHKAQNNLIIVATHDQNLIEFASTVFNLKRETNHD